MKDVKNKSKKNSINAIISLVVYPFDVMLSIGESDEQLKRCLKKFGCEWDELMSLPYTSEGRTVMLDTNHTVLRLKKHPESCSDYGTLAHEIFHAADFILRRIGIKLKAGSDEAYAYLIGYLTKEIYKAIKP